MSISVHAQNKCTNLHLIGYRQIIYNHIKSNCWFINVWIIKMKICFNKNYWEINAIVMMKFRKQRDWKLLAIVTFQQNIYIRQWLLLIQFFPPKNANVNKYSETLFGLHSMHIQKSDGNWMLTTNVLFDYHFGDKLNKRE